MIKKLIAGVLATLCLTGAAFANEELVLDKFPAEKLHDQAALQHGAKLFVNYCLNCHAASFMRYNRMHDIGLSDQQIKDNLLFATEKVGDLMKVSMDPKEAKAFFGATPPDLTLIARAREGGPDYLYTYLRGFYRDEARPSGWNNTVFPNVGMPHVLWQLQGEQRLVGEGHEAKLQLDKPGQLSAKEYDDNVADLVAFLTWMGEPAQTQRAKIGPFVIVFLLVLSGLAWRLNKAYWKDVK
jgi:ubiquinol-cytochrome c reductase cytochrome c1 subunit